MHEVTSLATYNFKLFWGEVCLQNPLGWRDLSGRALRHLLCYWLLVMHYWPSVKNSTENPEMVPVIGHLCHLQINYVPFNGFILNVSLLFGKLKENTTDFSAQKFLKTSNLEI